MTASYYFSPIAFSEVIDGRLEHLGIYVMHDEEGYEFFDGWNRVSAYIEDGSLRGVDAHRDADPGNVLDAIVEIWRVVVFADHDQPFAVVAAPDLATAVTAQAEADEHYFRQEWQSALNKRTELVSELTRSLNGEPVLMTLGGPLARIARMAQRIIEERPEHRGSPELLLDAALVRLISEDVDAKRCERETYGATWVSDSIRARLASPLAGQVHSARLKGDFHIFAFDSQGTVCVYVTSDEERRKWADVVNPRADKDERSGFISALQQWVRSSGLMSGTELDEIVVLTRDEYRVLAKRFSEVPFPRRYLLDHMLGRTRERLEAKWTQREDHVWVWKEREAA